MKFVYKTIIMIVCTSGYAYAAEVVHPVKSGSCSTTSGAALGFTHYYPGKPDSEEKMVMAIIIKKPNSHGLGLLRADSPYPSRIKVLHISDTSSDEENKSGCVLDRKGSVASYGSLSTIAVDTPRCIDTPVVVSPEAH